MEIEGLSLNIQALRRAASENAMVKLATPENADQLLRLAREAAAVIDSELEDWERLTDKELLGIAERLHALRRATAGALMFAPPDGLPHEPQVLAYHAWAKENQSRLMRELTNITGSIHDARYERFRELVGRLPEIAIAQRALKAEKSRGGIGKQAKDPKAIADAAARAAARKQWPEANRRGWTAERMWTALRDAGHNVKADTVRKWMTKLRKTGTC